jgi:cell division protein FtsQ
MRRPPAPSLRARRRARRARRPPVRAIGAFACVVALLAGVWLWLRDSDLVAVRQVTVTGVSGPDARRVRDALEAAARDMTTLHVRHGELRTAIEPFPTILRLDTDADFPHRLRISVHERNPVGAIVAGGQRVPVAADRTLMRETTSAGLPEITAKTAPAGARAADPAVRRAIAVLAAGPPSLRARVRRIYVGPRGWTLPLRNGPTLYLGGSDRLEAKWVSAVIVLADPTARGATYVDVRLPERPAAGGLEPLPAEPPDGDQSAAPGAAAGAAPAGQPLAPP